MALNPQKSLESKNKQANPKKKPTQKHPKKNLDHLKSPLHYETVAFPRANSKAIFNEPILPFIMSSFEYQSPSTLNHPCLQCYYQFCLNSSCNPPTAGCEHSRARGEQLGSTAPLLPQGFQQVRCEGLSCFSSLSSSRKQHLGGTRHLQPCSE